jgi:hypothetical protein
MLRWGAAFGYLLVPPAADLRWAGAVGQNGPMTRWEYVTVPLLVHNTKQILDTWGDDGWELVSIVPGPNPENLVAYLKRAKDEPGPRTVPA